MAYNGARTDELTAFHHRASVSLAKRNIDQPNRLFRCTALRPRDARNPDAIGGAEALLSAFCHGTRNLFANGTELRKQRGIYAKKSRFCGVTIGHNTAQKHFGAAAPRLFGPKEALLCNSHRWLPSA